MSIKTMDFDRIDRKIVELLSQDAQITSAALGKKVGLSASAVNERVRKLKARGIIKKIVAYVDSTFVNKALCSFIFVLVEGKENNIHFQQKAKKHPAVTECYQVTGEHSYILKVRSANTKELEAFISDFLKSQLGVKKTLTQVVLASIKEDSSIVD